MGPASLAVNDFACAHPCVAVDSCFLPEVPHADPVTWFAHTQSNTAAWETAYRALEQGKQGAEARISELEVSAGFVSKAESGVQHGRFRQVNLDEMRHKRVALCKRNRKKLEIAPKIAFFSGPVVTCGAMSSSTSGGSDQIRSGTMLYPFSVRHRAAVACI